MRYLSDLASALAKNSESPSVMGWQSGWATALLLATGWVMVLDWASSLASVLDLVFLLASAKVSASLLAMGW